MKDLSEKEVDERSDDSGSDDEKVEVDFDFFDPSEIDFHGIKMLLRQLFMNDSEMFDLSAITDSIIVSKNYGSVVKSDDSSSDPLALMTVVPLTSDPFKPLAEYILQKSSKHTAHERFEKAMKNGKDVVFLINERLINMPAEIVPPMFKMLVEELEYAISKKMLHPFKYFIMMSKTYREIRGLPEASDDEDNVTIHKKKKKKVAHKNEDAAILSFQYEEEVFKEYADEIYGEAPKKDPESASNKDAQEIDSSDDEVDVSVEDAFAKELTQLKDKKKRNRFTWMDVGIDCCLFVQVEDPIVPTEFVSAIMKDLDATKTKKTSSLEYRYTQRIVPVVDICPAKMDAVMEMAQKIIPSYFHKENQEQKKFAIVFNRRNDNTITRDELIPKLAHLVGSTHKVDLKNPDLVILVEVFKGLCGMSVLSDYYKLEKYNFETVIDDLLLKIFDSAHKQRECTKKKMGGGGRTKAAKRKQNQANNEVGKEDDGDDERKKPKLEEKGATKEGDE
ncbi:Mss4p nuclear export [Chytridiales sp. JEL 0842]|nr:Mss4p nuclear export [Chytridiales sp. JEL 0842]